MINKSLLIRLQLAGLVVALGGLALHLANASGSAIMLIAGMGTLAITFLVSGFLPVRQTANARLSNYAIKLALSVLTLGLLFKLMNWKGANIMLIQGTLGLIIGLVIKFLMPDKKEGQ
jgi:glucose dehydrogenase